MFTMVSNSDLEYPSSIKKKVRIKIITKRECMPKNMTANIYIYIFHPANNYPSIKQVTSANSQLCLNFFIIIINSRNFIKKKVTKIIA